MSSEETTIISFADISAQFSSTWPVDRALSSATTPSLCGPGSDGSEEVLYIPQSSSISGTSPSDCLVLFSGHSLGGGGLTPPYRSSQCILLPHLMWIFAK